MINATKKSIEHWERMVEAAKKGADAVDRLNEEPVGSDCALCNEFLFKSEDEDDDPCSLCPIYKRTGMGDCEGTPYGNAQLEWNQGRWDQFAVAGKRMVTFLKETLEMIEKGEIK